MSEVATARRLPGGGHRLARVLLIGIIGVVIALVALQVSQLPLSWFVYVLGAVVFTPVLLGVPHPRRFLLGLTIVTIQVNANMYFMAQGASTFVGASGPTAIQIPLCVIFAGLLFASQLVGFDTDAKRVVLPPQFARPVLYYLGAIALSGLATSERFLWLCYVVQQLLSMLVLVTVANAVRDEEDVRLVVELLMVSAIIQGLVFFAESAIGIRFNPEGYASVVENSKGHGGTFYTRSNGLAAFLMPLVLLSLTQFLSRRDQWGRRLAEVALAVGAAGLIGTMARAAWVAAALGGAFVFWAGNRRKLVSTSRVVMLGVGALVVAGLFAHSLVDRVSSDHLRDYEERKALMEMAFNVFRAHPVIGCGAGSYAHVFRAYLTAELEDKWLYVVHNRFMLTAAEMGVIGVAAFGSLFVAWFRAGYALLDARTSAARMLGLAFCGMVVGLVWNLYWDTLTGFPVDGAIYALLGLTAAVVRIEQSRPAEAVAAPESAAPERVERYA